MNLLDTPDTDLTEILKQLQSQQAELTRLRNLETEMATLREKLELSLSRNVSQDPDHESADLTDRRGMLKKAGAIAVGIATAGLLRPTGAEAAVNDHRQSAVPEATGGNLILGTINAASGTDSTSLNNGSTVLPTKVFRVDSFASIGMANPPTSDFTAGLFHINNAGATPTAGQFHAVYAVADSPAGGLGIGVYGEGQHLGVQGFSATGVGGSFRNGDNSDYSLVVADGLGQIQLDSNGVTVNPLATTNQYRSGVILKTTDAALWYSVGSGAPGLWRKLAGLDSAGTAHVLPSPVRFIDTRNGTGGATGPFNSDEARSYDFQAIGGGAVPNFARAIFGNITAASPGGNGNFQTNTVNSFPAGSAAVMSFTPGTNLSNHFVSALDANGVMFVRANVFNGTGQVHLVLDVQGYYL